MIVYVHALNLSFIHFETGTKPIRVPYKEKYHQSWLLFLQSHKTNGTRKPNSNLMISSTTCAWHYDRWHWALYRSVIMHILMNTQDNVPHLGEDGDEYKFQGCISKLLHTYSRLSKVIYIPGTMSVLLMPD